MATLMDHIMALPGQRDFTLGSRATFQPYDQPFSRGGTLGNMGMRNMQRAQTALAATGQPPAAAPEVPVDTMGTMYGFMPPAAVPAAPANIADMYAGYRLPPPPAPAAPASLADMYAGYRLPPMAPPPMNITPPAPAAPAGGFVAPANVPLPPPRPADMSVRESFMQRLLGNPTQSNAMPVVMSPQGPMPSGAAMPQQINWGDAENPADFFRASQALQAMPGLLG